MARHDLQGSTTRCHQCGTENFAFAPFCISCGEPLDEDTAFDPALPSPRHTGSPGDVAGESRPSVPTRSAFNRRIRWETWLGVGMVLLLLTYVAYDWARNNALSDAYRDGLAAVQQRDWDRAVQSLARAEDHLDAARLLQNASDNLHERDRLYYAALEASRRQQWRTAAAYFRRVQALQPDYKLTRQMLAASQGRALNLGLGNICYLVTAGTMPGLYVRDAAGHTTHLLGSDERSSVRAISPDGSTLVYDAPTSGVGTPPLYSAEWRSGDAVQMPGSERIAVVAGFDPQDVRHITMFYALPQLDGSSIGMLTTEGLWWYSSQPNPGGFGYEVYYWSRTFADTTGVSRVFELAEGRKVLAFDAPRNRLIVAETRGQARTLARRTDLYVTGYLTAQSHLVHVAGDVQQASVSADGRWLLYTTQLASGSVLRSVYAIRLDEPNAIPRQLDAVSWSGSNSTARLSASFLPSTHPGTPNTVIVDSIFKGEERLTLHDLDANSTTLLWTGGPEGLYRFDSAALSKDGNYLGVRRQSGTVAFMGLAGIAPGQRSWSSVNFPAADTQVARMYFSPREDHLLAVTGNTEDRHKGTTQHVYSARLDAEGNLGEARLIASAALPYDSTLPTIALPAEGSMLAYVTPTGDLHAVDYDGFNDLPVTANVHAVWSLLPRQDVSWRR